MFAGIIGWFVGLPPWAKKLMMYAAIALVALYLLRLYTNKIYDKGRDEGKVESIKSMEDVNKGEWEKKQKDIENAQKGLVTQQESIMKGIAENMKTREQITNTLNQVITASKTKGSVRIEQVPTIPASELDNSIRIVLNELFPNSVN